MIGRRALMAGAVAALIAPPGPRPMRVREYMALLRAKVKAEMKLEEAERG